MKEAAVLPAPLTVLTVHEGAASYWTGHPITFPVNEPARQKAAQAAQEAVAKAAAPL